MTKNKNRWKLTLIALMQQAPVRRGAFSAKCAAGQKTCSIFIKNNTSIPLYRNLDNSSKLRGRFAKNTVKRAEFRLFFTYFNINAYKGP
ncbi:MAG: hypothetical protein LBH43_16115 [Treponema sp.]|nr:hypothetical protein [Treponema sp.]